MPTNEHGDDYDEDWIPDSPILRGEVRVPDRVNNVQPDGSVAGPPDELPHRVRRQNGLDNEDPDPGYDPGTDDLVTPA